MGKEEKWGKQVERELRDGLALLIGKEKQWGRKHKKREKEGDGGHSGPHS